MDFQVTALHDAAAVVTLTGHYPAIQFNRLTQKCIFLFPREIAEPALREYRSGAQVPAILYTGCYRELQRRVRDLKTGGAR